MNQIYSALLQKAFRKNHDVLFAMDIVSASDLAQYLQDDDMIMYNLTMKAMSKGVNVDSLQFNKLLVDLGIADEEELKEITDTQLIKNQPNRYYAD